MMKKLFSKQGAFQINVKVLISFTGLLCICGCDFLTSKDAVIKYKNKIKKDSVLLNEFIYLSTKIEVDSVIYSIRPTRGGTVNVEEDKEGGLFLSNSKLNSDSFKESLYLSIIYLDASYIVFEHDKNVAFGFSDRNCGWNYFELIYLKDTTNYLNYFKDVSIYDSMDSLPNSCGKWIFRLDKRWVLYSE